MTYKQKETYKIIVQDTFLVKSNMTWGQNILREKIFQLCYIIIKNILCFWSNDFKMYTLADNDIK